MPGYEDQLAAYRAQLANISAMNPRIPASQPGSGFMATTGLAFNTMMSDLAGAASLVKSIPTVPSSSSVARIEGPAYHQMGLIESMMALSGLRGPNTPMYISDYRYLARERIGEAASGFATGAATLGIDLGAGIAGGYLGGVAGAAIGSAILPIGGTIIGGIAGSIAGSYLGSGLVSPLTSPVADIQRTTANIRAISPALFGGMGISRSAASDMSRSINRLALNRSEGWFGSPSAEMDLTNMAMTEGARYGLFAGTKNTGDFEKELSDLTKTIKEMSRAIRVSKEEMIPILAEMRQGGFYGAQAGGQAILATSGLAFGSGVGFQEMHETGLRGAAIFRGTGVPVATGYSLGQQNLYNARRMQQLGILGPEAINQMGGISGVAESLTAGSAAFTQGAFGRAAVAMIMQGNGGINQDALGALMSGQSIANVLSGANLDPAALANPQNVQRVWQQLGPGGIQRLQAGMLRSQAAEFRSVAPDYNNAIAMAMSSMGMDTSAANVDTWVGLTRNMPRLMAEQRNNIREERRRATEDRMSRENDIWYGLGVRDMGKGFHRLAQPISEGIAEFGESARRDFQEFGDVVMGRRRVDESEGSLARALQIYSEEDSAAIRPTGGTLTRTDLDIMSNLGMTSREGEYRYDPTRMDRMRSGVASFVTSGLSNVFGAPKYAATSANIAEYGGIISAMKKASTYKAAESDRTTREFFGNNPDLVLKEYNAQMPSKFKMSMSEFDLHTMNMMKGTYSAEDKTIAAGMARAAIKVAKDHGFKDSDTAATIWTQATYGKEGSERLAEALTDANTSGVSMNVDEAQEQNRIAKEELAAALYPPEKRTSEARSAIEKIETPEFRELLKQYTDGKITHQDFKKKCVLDLGITPEAVAGMTNLVGIHKDPKRLKSLQEAAGKADKTKGNLDRAKFTQEVVAPYFKNILDDGLLGDAKELQDNILFKAAESAARGSEDVGKIAKDIGTGLHKDPTLISKLRKAGAKGAGLELFERIEEYASTAAMEAGVEVSKEHRIKAAQIAIGELQGKREGTESVNASERQAAAAAAFKDPVQQKMFETVNGLYTAVKTLNKEIDDRKKE